MLKHGGTLLTMACLGCLLAGCGEATGPAQSAADSKFLLTAEPAGAQDVKAARAAVNDGDEVVVVGRIGGEEDPWVAGAAAFSIVDRSLKPCNERPGDNCEKPWDYCCDTDLLPSHRVLVKVVDANGKLVSTDARKLLAVKELETVVVRGKAQKDEAGNVTVLATGVFVKK